MKQEKTEYTVQSVDKALDLLEILTEQPGALTLPALAEKTGLTRNKAFRLLATLCQRGLVEKDPINGSYNLGLSSAVLGQKFMKNISLTSHAHPIMEELAKRHDEAVYVTVMKDCDVLFLDMVDCHQSIKAAPFVGRQVPFFTIAAGKAMKALDSRDLLEKLLKRRGIKNAPDLDKLETELHAIRSRGVAVDTGGLGEGIISVAVAIKDYAGKVVGAITVLGPSFRMLTERLEKEIIPSVLEGAETLSQKFGYAPA